MSVLFSHFKNGGRVQIDKALFATRPRVLNLAPHPDDFDVAGVTFRRMHDAGCDIHLAVLTSGAAGVQDRKMKTHPKHTQHKSEERSC